MLTNNEKKNAIKFSTSNEEAIKKSKLVACYYCKKVFKAEEVVNYLEKERTALCPNCTIDTVLSDNAGYSFDKQTLDELNKFWFMDSIKYK